MRPVPPLAHVTGTVEPGECFGGFGPVDAFLWRGACVGRCGARPGVRAEGPAPECSGCARARHGIAHTGGAIGRITPVPARILPGELDEPYRVLVTASRTWDDVATLHAALDERRRRVGRRMVVVHGHCPDGGDAIADAWALRHLAHPPERHPADWPAYGRAAGPIRNSAMVATRPDECLAFIRDGSTGTADCAGKAERAGIPTTRYVYGEPMPPTRPDVPKIYDITVLRPAVEVSTGDPSLPRAVRALCAMASGARVFAAVVSRQGVVSASLAVRVPGVGHGIYERPEGGSWEWSRGVLDRPHLRRCNAGQFAAAVAGTEYVPPAPREPAPKGSCPACGAEVSLTKAGAVFKSHKCGTKTVEGRS